MLLKRIVIILIVVSGFSCTKVKKEPAEQPLARVYELYLYPSDLAGKYPAGITPEDSIKITRRLIEEWTRERLMLKRAEQYLSESDKNVQKQIEDYRLSLLTFKYKQNLLSTRLDTVIRPEEILKYYESYSSNYILDSDVIKATFIKVPVTAPYMQDVRKWYRSDDIEDLDKLEKYCLNYASRYVIKGDTWVKFNELLKGLPVKTDNPAKYYGASTNIEAGDSVYNYFIHIFERINEGKVAPVELVEKDIRTVILNKRKFEFIQDLENSIYKDGIVRNQVEIF